MHLGLGKLRVQFSPDDPSTIQHYSTVEGSPPQNLEFQLSYSPVPLVGASVDRYGFNFPRYQVHGAQTVDGEVPAEEASGKHVQSNDTQTTNSINIQ